MEKLWRFLDHPDARLREEKRVTRDHAEYLFVELAAHRTRNDTQTRNAIFFVSRFRHALGLTKVYELVKEYAGEGPTATRTEAAIHIMVYAKQKMVPVDEAREVVARAVALGIEETARAALEDFLTRT